MYKIIQQFLKFLLAFFSKGPENKKKREVWNYVAREKKIPLLDLAKAMAEFEGYFSHASRAARNKNPLNLKSSKFTRLYDAQNFCIFETIYDGWKAGLWDLKQKCRGYTRTGLGPLSTIRSLIYIWTADNQEPYTQFVCQKLKIPSDYQLKEFDLKEINLTLGKYLDLK